MAKGQKKGKPIQSVAVLRTNVDAKCAFCHSNIDDEVKFGKLYTLGTITCHYYCVLLSSCLVQKGKDDEGILGFLESDLVKEIARGKKLRCNYCGLNGATLACCTSVCKRQFHLPCGKVRGTISLFYGNYQSFCMNHGPKQHLPTELQVKVNARIAIKNKSNKNKSVKTKNNRNSIPQSSNDRFENTNGSDSDTSESRVDEQVCPICYEEVEAFPSVDTLWPPCCRGDRWFHRNCVERLALSAARHYLRCPLCNDKSIFCKAVLNQGVYIPDRDASWELDQGAYSELHGRKVYCNAEHCLCSHGRGHNVDDTCWEVIFCASCGNGSEGLHIQCLDENSKKSDPPMFRCADCLVVPVETIVKALEIESENRHSTSSNGNVRRVQRPVMPVRMSLRRAMLSTYTPRQVRSRESTVSGSSNCTEASGTSEKDMFPKESVVNISSHNNDDVDSSIDVESINDVISEDDKYTSLKVVPEFFTKVKPCPKSKKHKYIRKILNEEIEKMTIQPTLGETMNNDNNVQDMANQSIRVITHVENCKTKVMDEEKLYEKSSKNIGSDIITSENTENTQNNIHDISISSNESINVSMAENCDEIENISKKENSCYFQCSYDHHTKEAEDTKSYLKTVIDFAIDAALKFSQEKSRFENNSSDDFDSDKIIENSKSDKIIENSKSDKIIENSESDKIIENSESDKIIENSKSDRIIENFESDKILDHTEIININNSPDMHKIIVQFKLDEHLDHTEINNTKNNSNMEEIIGPSKPDKVNNYNLDKHTDNCKGDNAIVESENVIDKCNPDKHLYNSRLDKNMDYVINYSEINDLKLDSDDDIQLDNVMGDSEIEEIDNTENTSHSPIMDKRIDNSKLDEYVNNTNKDANVHKPSPVFFISTQTKNKRKHVLTVKTKIGNENIIDNVEICELNDPVENTKQIVEESKHDKIIASNLDELVDSGLDKLINNAKDDISFDNSLMHINNTRPILPTNTHSSEIKHLLTVKTKIGKENVIDDVEITCEIKRPNLSDNVGNTESDNLVDNSSLNLFAKKLSKCEPPKNNTRSLESVNDESKLTLFTKNKGHSSSTIFTRTKTLKKSKSLGTPNKRRRSTADSFKTRKSLRLVSDKSSNAFTKCDLNESSQDSDLEIFENKTKSRGVVKSKRSQSDPVETSKESKPNNRKHKPITSNPVESVEDDIETLKETNVYYVVNENKTSEMEKKLFSTCESKTIIDSNNIDSIKCKLKNLNGISIGRKNYNDKCDFQENAKKNINTETKILRTQSESVKNKERTKNFVKENKNKLENMNKVKNYNYTCEKLFKNRKSYENVEEINIVYLKPKGKCNISPKRSIVVSETTEPNYVFVKTGDEKKNVCEDMFFLKSNDDLDREVIFTPKKTFANKSETKNSSDNRSNSFKLKHKKTPNKCEKFESPIKKSTLDDEVVLMANKFSEDSEKHICTSENAFHPLNDTILSQSYETQSKKGVDSNETEEYISGNSTVTSKNINFNKNKSRKRKKSIKIDNSDEEVIFTPKKNKTLKKTIQTINLDSSEENNGSNLKDDNSSCENYETDVIFAADSDSIRIKIAKNKRDAFKLRIKRKNKHSRRNKTDKTNLNKVILKSTQLKSQKNLNTNKVFVQTRLNLSPQKGFIKFPNGLVVDKKKVVKKRKDCDSNMKQTTIGNFFIISP